MGLAGAGDLFREPEGALIASRNASRFPLMPASLLLLFLALCPGGLTLVCLLPGPVMEAVLFCLMVSTVYAALLLITRGACHLDWTAGLVVGAALTGGTVVTFMPAAARQALHPLLASGFVVGLVLALLMEHLVLGHKPPPAEPTDNGEG
ncbi:membrane hypothetical protein [Desulfarculales bacterium]